ncbi:integrase [Inquilinus ginsengisoli]|uniref:Integrase n=1 Tax=Inquilinus ginsengisoli TaxID=363840 RepID=A0ABU1JQH7_9PROT|nr:tyrosine-type recombinase/integrase [Inquilinus ginsengisoli]MDR6290866.1 integrase [Inquilinus ginsengisoli]
MTDILAIAVASASMAPVADDARPQALTEAQIAEIRALAEKADELVSAASSANTKLAYGKAWRAWSDWCLRFGLDPVSADSRWLVLHLTALAETRSLSTIELRRSAVVTIRKRLGHPVNLDLAGFDDFIKGLRRTKGARPTRKAALLEENLRAAMLLIPADSGPDPERARRLRDRALLLTGFAGGFRRSELAGFDLRHAILSAEGLVLFVAGSKTDQERDGAEVGIRAVPGSPLCAVTALRAWLAVRGDLPGALFCRIDRGGHLVTGSDGRHPAIAGRTVALLVKRVIRQAGLDAAEFSAHSLRAGMMTAADRKSVPLERAMEHGRWKSLATARGYRRHSSLWVGNFTEALLRDE